MERYWFLSYKKGARESSLEQLRTSVEYHRESSSAPIRKIFEEELTRRLEIEKEEEEMQGLMPMVEEWNKKQLLKAMGVWTEDSPNPPPKRKTKPTLEIRPEKPILKIVTNHAENLLPPPPNKQMKTYYEEIQEGIRHGCGCLVMSEGEWKERVKQECDDCYYTYGDGSSP